MRVRASLRFLLGLLALLSSVVDPAAKLVHGVVHLREAHRAAQVASAQRSPSSRVPDLAPAAHHDDGDHDGSVSAPDHTVAHAALHQAGGVELSTVVPWALPATPRHVVPAPPAVLRVSAVEQDVAPPPRVVVARSRPRAPPLG